MPDINSITTLIGSVGFPIAMCLMMAWYIKGEQDVTRETLTQLKSAIQTLTEEIKDLERLKREEREHEV